jgi:uncharacterized protein (UPF0548 family)
MPQPRRSTCIEDAVFLLRQPSVTVVQEFLRHQRALGLTYAQVGATATTPPAGFLVDHTRTELGVGSEVFERAKQGLRRWRQFDLGWIRAWPADTPLEEGQCVSVLAQAAGLWSLNAARIVYAINEPRRFGFAYGTLPGHVEMGEERFLIEQADSGAVSYDILAFSRVRHPLARLAYPLARRLQKRFARESAAAMRHFVRE